MRDGHGCHRQADGAQYSGEFRNNKPHGHGALVFASGQRYEGQWAAGQREGWCQYSVSASELWAGAATSFTAYSSQVLHASG